MALLGDAAHPVLRFLAQGGGVLALGDACRAGRCASVRRAPRRRDGAARSLQPAQASAKARNVNARLTLQRPHLPSERLGRARLRNRGCHAASERLMGGYDWLYGWAPPGAAALEAFDHGGE